MIILPKPDLGKTETAMTPDEKSHGLGAQRESSKPKWPIIHFFPDDFGSRNLVIQKTFSPKKGIPLWWHSSLVDRVALVSLLY